MRRVSFSAIPSFFRPAKTQRQTDVATRAGPPPTAAQRAAAHSTVAQIQEAVDAKLDSLYLQRTLAQQNAKQALRGDNGEQADAWATRVVACKERIDQLVEIEGALQRLRGQFNDPTAAQISGPDLATLLETLKETVRRLV